MDADHQLVLRARAEPVDGGRDPVLDRRERHLLTNDRGIPREVGEHGDHPPISRPLRCDELWVLPVAVDALAPELPVGEVFVKYPRFVVCEGYVLPQTPLIA